MAEDLLAQAVEAELFGEENDAADLFGDFNSDAELKSPSQASSRKRRLKQAQPESAAAGDGEEAASGSGSRPQPDKRRRKKDLSSYFETEAEEAGASSDEAEDDDLDGLIDDTGVAPGETGRNKLRKEMMKAASKELEELTRDSAQRGPLSGARGLFSSSRLDDMEQRYKDLEERGAAGEDIRRDPVERPGKKETHTVTVPEPTDPKLWCCKSFGPERELCICLMHKAMEYMQAGKPVPIHSVFFSPHLRGYIYFEAHRESDVRDFIRGKSGLSAFSAMSLVPQQQMPMVFTASVVDADKQTVVQVGDWVRLKRGTYLNDLAQVEEVQDGDYTLKLKPRLEFRTEAMKKALKDVKGGGKKRIPTRWFNKADLESADTLVNSEPRRTQKGHVWYYIVDGEAYRDGFLYKNFKGHWFTQGEAVRPQEFELQEWRNAPPIGENTRPAKDLGSAKAEEDRKLMPPPMLPTKASSQERPPLEEGDLVIVILGDLKNLRAEVSKALFGSPTVLIRPLFIDGIQGHINISVTRLCKYFEVGDYVKIVAGENLGETGYITKVELGSANEWSLTATASILSSTIAAEFRVKLDHLRLTNEKTVPQDFSGEFKVGQLVQVAGRSENRGIIVRLEADARAVILGADGKKHGVDFAELDPIPVSKKSMNSSWCLDRKGQKLNPRCMVNAPRSMTGSTAPIRAEILFIYNNTCFLRASDAFTGERAFLVCPGDRTEFVWDPRETPSTKGGGKGARKPPEEPEEPEQKQISYGVQMASQMSFLRPTWYKQLGLAAPTKEKASFDITQKGAGVRITGGSYKGLRGEVRDFLGQTVRISLLSKPKIVEVSVNYVSVDDYLTPRVQRWPNSVPLTPPVEVMIPVAKRITSGSDDAVVQLAEKLANEGRPSGSNATSEDNEWDPDWLMKEVPEALEDDEGDATGGAAAADARETEHVVQPPSRGSDRSERRRRMPRIPGAGVEASPASPVVVPAASSAMPGTPLAAPGTPQLVPFSLEPFSQPYSPFSHEPPGRGAQRATKARAPWLMSGLGVRYTDTTGESKCGWICKVYVNMVTVLPAHEQAKQPLPLEGSETRPWTCERRGDTVLAFDGPRRGCQGKIVGLQGNLVFIRAEAGESAGSLLTAAGGDMVRADKKDVAMYSPDPIESVKAWLARDAREDAASEAARSESRKRPISEASEPWLADVRAAAAASASDNGGEVSPRSNLEGDTPQTVGEQTPMVVVADTPPQSATQTSATPFVQGGFMRGMVTPMPGGATPMLQGGTPMFGRLGALTPGLPGAGTPLTPAPGMFGQETPGGGADTPMWLKKAENDSPGPKVVKGSETPMTPMPGMETPRPLMQSKLAPMTPGGVTPGLPNSGVLTPAWKKAEDTPPGGQTPLPGDQTPFVGAPTPFMDAKVEAQTPGMEKTEGAVTPLGPPPGGEFTPGDFAKGENTPGLDKGEGAETPANSSGDRTPNVSAASAPARRRVTRSQGKPD